MRTNYLLAALFILAAGCKTRLYDLEQSGDSQSSPPADQSFQTPPIDFAAPLDLTVFPDLLPPPDLTPPHYCDGIYVFDESQQFSFFDPKQLQFHDIAILSCPASPGATPFSMALRRDGIAFVEYTSGELFRVNSQSGLCAATNFNIGQHGFQNFGMGFASDGPNSANETLYVAGFPMAGLASIDLQTLALNPIAPLPWGAELTGTGAGELWGFFGESPAHAGRIDKATGQIAPDFPLPQLGDVTQDGYAFGFFGGVFYIFLVPPGGSTSVYRFNPADGSVSDILMNTGRRIIGAGVSTCAPQQ